MPDTNDRVMAMVESELAANPEMSNEELRTKAEKLDDSIAQLSARQFNARYPLQVKRRLQPRQGGSRKAARKAGRKGARKGGRAAGGTGAKRGRPAGSGRKEGSGRKPGRPTGSRNARAGSRGAGAGRSAANDGARGRVRSTLLDFARDLASADGAGLVDVIAGVDGYVDRVMKATGSR